MSTFPATNSNEAVELIIDGGNQLHQIINEDATTEIQTESGPIPSVRKAITDTFLFQDPLPWSEGNNEISFNQLRTFEGSLYWAPTATTATPVPMGVTPIGDSNWNLAPVNPRGYQGLWPDTGGSALKDEVWQTQISGVPTGNYYTALQNTTVDPVGDNVNWKVDVSGSYVNQAQEELINGKIFPESGTVKNGDTIPVGTTLLRVLLAGEPMILVAWDNLILPATVTSVPASENNQSGYDVVTDQGTFEFITLETEQLRGKRFDSHTTYPSHALGWGFPLDGVTDSATSVNTALLNIYSNSGGGGEVIVPVAAQSLASQINIPHGCILRSTGIPHTFTTYADATTFLFEPSSLTAKGIVLGQGGINSTLRNRAMQVENIQIRGTSRDGVAFSSVDTEDAANENWSFNFQINKCTVHSVYIGFDLINTFNNTLKQTTAINCDIGHRVSGNVTGGTSNFYEACLSYNCRIGWDIPATGWNYSSMVACGSDGCEIGLRISGASHRGSKINNFGIENIDAGSGSGFGVYLNAPSSGNVTIDGITFGTHDDANITFIRNDGCEKAVISNVDFGSTTINTCKFYGQTDNTVGKITFRDCQWFGANLGDIYESNVTLENVIVNGRRFRLARGGLDLSPQTVNYTSSSLAVDVGQGASNKQLFSVDIKADTNSDGNNRFLAGTPVFRTDNIQDWEYIKITNATNPDVPAIIGIRTDDFAAGSNVVRDPALTTTSTINLNSPGDYVVLQKRPDGLLYQVELVEVGI